MPIRKSQRSNRAAISAPAHIHRRAGKLLPPAYSCEDLAERYGLSRSQMGNWVHEPTFPKPFTKVIKGNNWADAWLVQLADAWVIAHRPKYAGRVTNRLSTENKPAA